MHAMRAKVAASTYKSDQKKGSIGRQAKHDKTHLPCLDKQTLHEKPYHLAANKLSLLS